MLSGSQKIEWRRALAVLSALIPCLAAVVLLSTACQKTQNSDIRERARKIGEHYGILIGYGSPDTFFVPPYTSKDSQLSGMTAKRVDIDSLSPALDGIEESLAIYPPGFFSNHCKAIFICDSLKLGGKEAGGTYGKAWIILDATKKSGRQNIYDMARLGLHHEFSSIVWNDMPELRLLWVKLLPIGWKPSDNPLKNPDLVTRAADGFLSQYGATSAENDFNVYAEKIFTEGKSIASMGKKQMVIAHKIALLMAAYERIDGRMAAVFDNMGLGGFRSVGSNPLDEPVELQVSPTKVPQGELAPVKQQH